MPMKYMTVLEAARKWGISDRRVRFLCSQGRIRGIIQQGRRYLIPDTTEKPRDERVRRAKSSDPRKYNDFTRLDFLKGMVSEQPEPSSQVLKEREQDFIRRFACSSTMMEGNTLSQAEVDEVLNGRVIPGHSLQEHMAVVGCKDAMMYSNSCVQERKPLSQNIIRNIHSLVLLDQPLTKGKYRRVKVRLKGADSSPVYLDLMEPRVNDLLNINTQRKKVMHPIERIARFYLEFQGIHPFEDGNGRTARVLLNLELEQNGYPPIIFQETDQEAYSQAMNEFFESQDAASMVRLISKKVENEMEKYLSSSRKRKSKKGLQTRQSAEKQAETGSLDHADPLCSAAATH